MTTPPRVIAEIRSADGWAGLVDGFRKAFDELGTSYRVVNDIAGLAEGHAEKLLAPVPIRVIGPRTFGTLLGALGAKILICVDETALASLRSHSAFQPRRVDAPSRHTSQNVRKAKRRRRKRLSPDRARMMRGRLMLLSTPRQRSKWARIAARARWPIKPDALP